MARSDMPECDHYYATPGGLYELWAWHRSGCQVNIVYSVFTMSWFCNISYPANRYIGGTPHQKMAPSRKDLLGVVHEYLRAPTLESAFHAFHMGQEAWFDLEDRHDRDSWAGSAGCRVSRQP